MCSQEIELVSVIKDIAAGPFGSNLKVSSFTSYGFPIIDGANLKDYKVSDNITKFVSETKARSLHRSIAHRGDVIVTISGTIGQMSYIPMNSKYSEYLCSQRQFRVTFDKSKVYIPYIVFYFHTYEGKNKILSFANQTGVPALSQPLKNFKKIRLTLPSLYKQKQIASIIEKINEKIESNKQINDNLAELLQALYQQQFCCLNCPDNQGRLADLCDYSKAKVAVTELSLSTYYSTENMLPGKAGAVDAASLPTTTQVIKCQIGDVLISNIRPYFKKIVYCHSNCGCSMDVICFTPKLPRLSAYLYSALYADSFFDFMVAGSKGTKMPRGDKQQIMTYAVHIPTEEEIKVFNALAIPILEQIENTHRENIRLSSLRDSLLPKLMSGELDVSELGI